MFTSTSNSSSNQDQKKLNLDQEKDLLIEDFPIHTMKKDLENVNNPEYMATIGATESNFAVTGKIEKNHQEKEQALNDKQRTSPFLSQEGKTQINQVQREEKIETNNPTIDSTKIKINHLSEPALQKNTSSSSSSSWSKIMTVSIIIFAVLSAAFGGYYFWTTRQQEASPQVPVNIPVDVPIAPSQPVVTSLSTDKPNYLNIDIAATDQAKIKETIANYAQKVLDLKATTPVEFIITDSQNNPIGFSAFANASGVALSNDIMTNLDDKFSLFIYSDAEKPHVGLSIISKDIAGTKLKSALTKSEKTIQNSLTPIFLTSDYTIKNAPFATSFYNGAEIRYSNITSPEELSTDYTIFQDKLLIGTTKMTLRSIIDHYVSLEPTPISTPTNDKTTQK
jgi:hypothetical protein